MRNDFAKVGFAVVSDSNVLLRGSQFDLLLIG
jgi:hypothetical protein